MALKGHLVSKETRKKLSETMKRLGYKPPPCTHIISEEQKRKISESMKGNRNNYGKKLSKEAKRRQSKNFRGEKNPNWKGGIDSVGDLIRSSRKYKQWRMDCFIRDNFTCQICKEKASGNLEVHHKKPFYKFMIEIKKYLPLFDLYEGAMIYNPLWDLDNGITFCKKCHKNKKRKTH